MVFIVVFVGGGGGFCFDFLSPLFFFLVGFVAVSQFSVTLHQAELFVP